MMSQAKYNKFEDYSFSKSFVKNNTESSNLFSYSYRNELKPIYHRNHVEAIPSNTKSYSEVIRLIRSAKDFIHMETYILRDGFFLRTLIAELILKAKSGVKVRFLYDWYGGWQKFKRKQVNDLREAGVEVGVFNPPGINIFKSATNYRLHRKAIIIDNKYAFYGGSNIGDEYLSIDPKKYYWRDQNFIFEGEIVNSLNIVFINDWLDFTDDTVKPELKQELLSTIDKYLKIHKASKTENMQLCTNTPNYEEKGIMNLMAIMMLRAKKSIKLVTPYFLPTELCLSALKIAARSGVNVQIVLPGKRDNKSFIMTMNRGQYTELLNVWCKVYEYDGFIHSKYLIVDDKYVLTTSANFDFRSFWSDFEDGILVDSPKFSRQMKQIFQNEVANSTLITKEKSKQLNTWWAKFRLALLNLYKPLL